MFLQSFAIQLYWYTNLKLLFFAGPETSAALTKKLKKPSLSPRILTAAHFLLVAGTLYQCTSRTFHNTVIYRSISCAFVKVLCPSDATRKSAIRRLRIKYHANDILCHEHFEALAKAVFPDRQPGNEQVRSFYLGVYHHICTIVFTAGVASQAVLPSTLPLCLADAENCLQFLSLSAKKFLKDNICVGIFRLKVGCSTSLSCPSLSNHIFRLSSRVL